MIDALLSLIAPHRCCSCGTVGAILCESCKINILDDPYEGCVLCQKPCGRTGLCSKCKHRLPCEQIWCVGERQGALKGLLDAYKFSSSRVAALPLASLLDVCLPLIPPGVAVVAIPTTAKTRRVRGFDHMGLIVAALAKQRGLTVCRPLERASSHTMHFLSRKERLRLGPSLFRLSGTPMPKEVLLVDDIVTTGTTLKAAATLLKQAGAKKIYIAVIARQPEIKK